MTVRPWRVAEIAFHGGTSLHLSWRSSRFSEDLDFLLTEGKREGLRDLMQDVQRRMREQFIADDPLFDIAITDKSKTDVTFDCFRITVSHRDIIGNAIVKAEFLSVDKDYLTQYPTTFRQPLIPGQAIASISSPVPAAELKVAFADKLTAFATRPHLKWRDIYDLWWIGSQTGEVIDLKAATAQFLHNVTAFRTVDGLPPSAALRRFLEIAPETLLLDSKADLQKWLPPRQWALLYPAGVQQMIDYARTTLRDVAALADGLQAAQVAGNTRKSTATKAARGADAAPPASGVARAGRRKV